MTASDKVSQLKKPFLPFPFSGRQKEDYALRPWQTIASLNKARAFASAVTYEIEFNNTVMYVLGGYSKDTGFLNSVEKYDKNTDTFTEMTWSMPESKSHFCTLYVEVSNDMGSIKTYNGLGILVDTIIVIRIEELYYLHFLEYCKS